MSVALSRSGNKGFSLVELMVGMLLGLILIAGAISIYLASKQSYVEVEQVATLTENARFAEQIMGDSLRHVGFFGEVAANRVEAVSDNLPAVDGGCTGPAGAYDLEQFVSAATVNRSGEVLDAYGNPIDCISEADDDVMPETNVLIIKHALPRPYSDGPREDGSGGDSSPGNGVIDSLQDNKLYVMTNNVSGLLFHGATPPTITTGGEIPDGVAWEYQYEVFYIRDGEVPQLNRKFIEWDGTKMILETELVAEGVENLQLLFGYDGDDDGEVDTYSSLEEISSLPDIDDKLSRVESVEVFLLVRNATEDAQYIDNKTYTLGSETVEPKYDHYRRLISHSSVSLRNLKLIIRGDA